MKTDRMKILLSVSDEALSEIPVGNYYHVDVEPIPDASDYIFNNEDNPLINSFAEALCGQQIYHAARKQMEIYEDFFEDDNEE